MAGEPGPQSIVVHLGREEIVLRQRYEAISIVNDILIAVWFIAGSIMFFTDAWETTGTWCFLAGSVELLVRPLIRLSRNLHLQRVGGGQGGPSTSQDF